MNPLTLVKRIQNLNSKEAALGISDEASWHAKYRESAYVFVGGIPFDLTEGDLLAVFAQYGEIVDVNLVRDKGTGKSKGFAFIAYENQQSTNLAVDNLNGAQILGRIIRVDHVSNYKKKEEEDEETLQKKREERGVCRAFQRGECNRGAGCKFSHDEQRAANTGWGSEDNKSSRWGHDKFEGSRSEKQSGQLNRHAESAAQEDLKLNDKDVRSSRGRGDEGGRESRCKRNELRDKELESRGHEKRLVWKERETKEDRDRQAVEKRRARNDFEQISKEDRRDEKRLRTHDFEQNSRDNWGEEKALRMNGHERRAREDRRVERRSRRSESERHHRDDREDEGGDKRSAHNRDSSSHRLRGTDEDQCYRSRQ